MSTIETFNELKEVLTVYERPFSMEVSVGTIQLPRFFTFQETNYIDFTNASDSSLLALSQACEPASFGLNNEEVVDESYRRAEKLDPTDFSVQFSPFTCGIVDSIGANLLRGKETEKPIRVELYKLNVYG
ncbi:hypothetical protein CPB84DRAFT_1826985 [Gymnopilus junonius]|uniref:Uncharacterized protein n=1 Tax=Gymnopilus junonius TaxID=109634 RepID=A0A9P5NIF9_GYMJU|nr:hypothetical protein CPB84DRAFT_1826985 [Gymnopilus junonius]